jgi:hypothetical protein
MSMLVQVESNYSISTSKISLQIDDIYTPQISSV